MFVRVKGFLISGDIYRCYSAETKGPHRRERKSCSAQESRATSRPKSQPPTSVVHQQQKRTAAAQPCSSPPSHAAAQPSWEIPTTAHHSANCNSPFGFCCF
ncbi:hypothetical protein SLEP1_g34351 [Rubroshorea leprosula]|uniref:Uncharacterized protein n=1 Tax=Rubroshorea leprosula TaxID=152421 RepID=A0AAV5KJK6_9ROSI|nr:hypothetical protein SLEP1_g34351 [Rubroshorea leprosula]